MVPARLVIVVASWACSVVSQVEASLAKDGSLAELRHKFLDKLKEDSTGPGGHSLHSLQEMASALLQSDSDPYNLSLQTPVMYQLVNLTRELDEQLSAQLLIQHEAAEAALNNFSGWADCNSARDECLAGPTTTSNPLTTTTTGVASSTSTTVGTTTTSTYYCSTGDPCCEMQNCSDEEDDLRLHMNYTCSELARENRSVDDVKNERCNETWATTYEDYLERDIEKLATLQLLNENCTNWTQKWLNQTGTCAERALSCRQYLEETLNENQTVVQDENLTISYLRYECCFGQNASYDICMSSAAITWQDEVNSQLILAESRQTEWRAVKRIMCLTDVLLMNASQDQRGALEACIAASYNASHLVLDLQAKPSPLECDNQTFVPSGW